MKSLKGKILSVSLSAASVLGIVAPISNIDSHASAAFETYKNVSHDALDPMGSVTYTSNKEYNIADGQTGAGYFSGGQKYIGPRVGTSAANAKSTIQIKVSDTSKGKTFKIKTIKTNNSTRKQPGVGPRLDAVPNFSFVGVNAKSLENRSQLTRMKSGYVEANQYSAGKTAFDGNTFKEIKISNKRMDKGDGFRLFASMTPLKNKEGNTLSKARLSISTPSSNGVKGYNANLYSSTGNAKTVLKGYKSAKGETTIKLNNTSVNLLLAHKNNIKAGTYQATINWTLANSRNATWNQANANGNQAPTNLK